ncbi:SEC-C motif-containing protein [Panacagrimonas perspica]|uniref:SEC-C motif-containing protein n=1 Tax=Panacagrimonas perspica TaxID=381431 RepID=A0A4R7PAK9_9GAMM|nr:YchJ family metal-binding protein [Panacagrimonas perspica]TDU31085.1 SEC-C motif-containing protein [Panacagrimonas perspica]
MNGCPCGLGHSYAECCQPWHAGAPAPTAESLMRSRYTAFAMELESYLLTTWHRSTRPPAVEFEPGTRWLGLSVKAAQNDGPDLAHVEFVARYRVGGGSAVRLHERSRFVRESGAWFYVDGITPSPR